MRAECLKDFLNRHVRDSQSVTREGCGSPIIECDRASASRAYHRAGVMTRAAGEVRRGMIGTR